MNTGSPRIEDLQTARATELAPAKINLALHVTGRRADGYHDIETLAVFAATGDRIDVAVAARDSLVLTGPFAHSVPDDDGNLVLKARDALRGAFPEAASLAFAIQLEKNLPVASGIGGGSSDAAAAMRAIACIAGINLDGPRAAPLARGLGADVPMCLAARPLIARGIGERLEPAGPMPALAIVLANPGVAVSTPEVFSRLECRDNPPLPLYRAPPDRDGLVSWLKTTRNDLQPAAIALAPQIGEALSAIEATRPLFARMSGSGATCFGLFSTDLEAEAAAAAISVARPDWFVVATRF